MSSNNPATAMTSATTDGGEGSASAAPPIVMATFSLTALPARSVTVRVIHFPGFPP